jgi:hypothetical protein
MSVERVEHDAPQPTEKSDQASVRACADCDGTGLARIADWDDAAYDYGDEPCESCGGRGAVPVETSEARPSFDYAYARLLHTGVSNCNHVLEQQSAIPPEHVARWTSETAEPWWQAMRNRAMRDGLRIDCRVAGDGPLQHLGWETHIAAAHLLSPDGAEYCDEQRQEASVRDWGETLTAAREQHPYDFAFERDRDRQLAAQRAYLEKFFAERQSRLGGLGGRGGGDADP